MAQVIGFIGLGIMGRPMAKNLLKAGYPLIVHSRSQGPVQELVGAGAKAAAPAQGRGRAGDVVITMLPNSPDVELVALGKDGLIEGAKRGQLFADMSTISPLVSQKVGKALGAKGVRMLDAPVSGGEKGAIDAALSIMVGGEQGRLRRGAADLPGDGQDHHASGPARVRAASPSSPTRSSWR